MFFPANFEEWTKSLSIVGAAIVFLWGIVQFTQNQNVQTETRRIEATRPFLERQLKLYTEATQVAALLANSKNPEELKQASLRFWLLYWGELALVEDMRVESAMIAFGSALLAESSTAELKPLSIALAHAIRDSLAESWGVKQWRNPHEQLKTVVAKP